MRKHCRDACHSFAIAKTWQRSVRNRGAEIVDRPETKSKIRTKGSVRYIHIHTLAPSHRPPAGAGDREPGAFLAETYLKLKQRLQRRYPNHG
jgi:hypothetical protein